MIKKNENYLQQIKLNNITELRDAFGGRSHRVCVEELLFLLATQKASNLPNLLMQLFILIFPRF